MRKKQNCLAIFAITAALIVFGGVMAGPAWKKKQIKDRPPSIDEPSSAPKVLGETAENPRGTNLETRMPRPFRKTSKEIGLNEISAESFSVIDEPSGIVLLEKNPHLKLPIASLTKLMTALLAYDNLDLDEYILVQQADVLNISPNLNLKAEDEVKILDLLESMLVCSANDSAKTLADLTEKKLGEDFVALMNERAKSLGLVQTNFSNPVGFDSDYNYSTAEDLKKLAFQTQALAAFRNLSKKTEIRFFSKSGREFSCKASNKLLGKNYEIESIKTGYTNRAKGSIIAKVKQDSKSLLIVVVGSENREQDLVKLAEAVFNNFGWR